MLWVYVFLEVLIIHGNDASVAARTVSLVLFACAEIVKTEVVEILVALGSIGLAVDIRTGRTSEPGEGLVLPAGLQQRVRVGVVEPGVFRPDSLAGEFRALQCYYRRIGQTLITANAGLDDAELDLGVVISPARVWTSHDVECPVRAAKSPFAVGHERQVTTAAREPARGPELR